MIANGLDEHGIQRFQCMVEGCGSTFTEPHHSATGLPSFREVMQQEALAAYVLRRETGVTVAARLGVTRQTVLNWAKNVRWRVPEPTVMEDGSYSFEDSADLEGPAAELMTVDVDLLRSVRRSGSLDVAPYGVGARDIAWHDRAAYGELVHWLRHHRVERLPKIRRWDQVVFDRTASHADRQAVIEEARTRLAETHDELIVPPLFLRTTATG